MPTALLLPRISTNVRFAASALLFPELAGAWAERLFLTPPRNGAAAAALDLIDARSSMFEHKGRHIATWRWGSRDAPAVILAHGWGGYAAQMRAFVFPLLSAGYQVIAYDQPAHGVSEGRLTGLPDFADLLAELAWHHGEARAFIGHSLGGAAMAPPPETTGGRAPGGFSSPAARPPRQSQPHRSRRRFTDGADAEGRMERSGGARRRGALDAGNRFPARDARRAPAAAADRAVAGLQPGRGRARPRRVRLRAMRAALQPDRRRAPRPRDDTARFGDGLQRTDTHGTRRHLH